jgi:hypothetical protein
MKHTPAPWTITQTEFAGATAIMVDPVAIVLGHGQTPDANAKLIAAAPRMWAMLRTLANMTTPMDGLLNRDSIHFDMVLAERSDETLCSDADALYRMIEEARTILDTI